MNKKSVYFIIGAIVISLGLFGIYFMVQQNGNKVIVRSYNKVYGEYDLRKDQTITVDVAGDYNIIEIKNGTVDVIESNCDNQICVYDLPISKDTPGIIVCLPHELIVEIEE
ncbi:MAG: NusG domain II-containing protein [Holdemanella sp.]|nr:NusG domain II-containing protein [Holdemanella sp.]